MKHVVSISLGSSSRDKAVETELLGQPIRLERRGSDGDTEKAARLFKDLDGKVDAFGLGGATLCLTVANTKRQLQSVGPLIRFVRDTPIVDGSGLKDTLEGRLAAVLDEHAEIRPKRRRALIMSATDRWGMARSFLDAGYECVFGDLLFALGLPIPLRTERALARVGRLLIPIVSRLPFSWLYPTGKRQERRQPRHESIFDWAEVIAGDCHFIKRFMPDKLEKKIIVTNTTTEQDLFLFQQAGARAVLMSTPPFEGRSYGTNLLEAALVAISGKKRPLDNDEIEAMLRKLALEPHLHIFAEGKVLDFARAQSDASTSPEDSTTRQGA